MKNQSQAGAKRPANHVQNQPTSEPGSAQLESLASHEGEELLIAEDGSYHISATVCEYFNGTRWTGYSSLQAAAAGIRSDNDPRLRTRKTLKPVTTAEAREWVLGNLVPFQLAPCFAPPLAGKHADAATVERIERLAERLRVTPDAIMCHAVQAFLEFADYRPDMAEQVLYYDSTNTEFIEALKWQPGEEATALLRGLYKEALRLPVREALARLAALRDLIAPHPSFQPERDAISDMLVSLSELDDLAGLRTMQAAA